MLPSPPAPAQRLQKLEAEKAELRERANAADTMFDKTKLRAIAKRYHLDLIVLFGSKVTGHANDRSDVDIAVRARDFTRTFRDWKVELRLARDLRDAFSGPSEVDLVVLNRVDSLLLRSVANDGVPLYESRRGAWIEFGLYANRRYFDDERYRRQEAEYLRKRYR